MNDSNGEAAGKSGVRVVRTLKDGYWDRTELVSLPDGSLRVRKTSNGDAPPGPWGVGALRREIEYLSTLPSEARGAFPPLLARWDDGARGRAGVGYEVPFYAEHRDAGELAQCGMFVQSEADSFQLALLDVLLERVHGPPGAKSEPFSCHVTRVVDHSLGILEADPLLARLSRAESLRLNGERRAGLRTSFARLLSDGVLSILDTEPQVRLHGDLFLENVLWRTTEPARCSAEIPQLLLIDPVSVAGVTAGPPLFDLVKYESYATGELLALRSESVDISGFDGSDDYVSRIRWQSAELLPYETLDLHTRFRRGFEARYGPVDRRASRLIDGYFSVVMAVNTKGVQRRARLLKATADFDAALAAS